VGVGRDDVITIPVYDTRIRHGNDMKHEHGEGTISLCAGIATFWLKAPPRRALDARAAEYGFGVRSLALLAALLQTGCVTTSYPSHEFFQMEEPVPEPARVETDETWTDEDLTGTNSPPAIPAPRVPALMRPGLVVNVTVLASGDIEIEQPRKRVSDDGDIALPLVGRVRVEGLSLIQTVEKLNSLYAEFFVNPQVVLEFDMTDGRDEVSPWGCVTVLGRVKVPGRVSIPPTKDLTVSKAIQKANGLDTSARDNAIRVTRRKADGSTETHLVDLRAVGSRGETEQDLVLQPGDVVFVPEMIF